VEDPDGSECPDDASIRREAIEGAREIMAEHIRKGRDVSDWSFEIVDEDNRPVMTVPFSEAIRR
jgi:hypothetical protein